MEWSEVGAENMYYSSFDSEQYDNTYDSVPLLDRKAKQRYAIMMDLMDIFESIFDVNVPQYLLNDFFATPVSSPITFKRHLLAQSVFPLIYPKYPNTQSIINSHKKRHRLPNRFQVFDQLYPSLVQSLCNVSSIAKRTRTMTKNPRKTRFKILPTSSWCLHDVKDNVLRRSYQFFQQVYVPSNTTLRSFVHNFVKCELIGECDHDSVFVDKINRLRQWLDFVFIEFKSS